MIDMAMKKNDIPKEFEKNILFALYKYYTRDITFERAAEEANVPIYFLVQFVNHNDLPIVHTEKDVTDGIQKVVRLMEEKGMDVSKLKLLA
jgi:hypothetical protein